MRCEPTTPASAAKGTREDPEVVSDDEDLQTGRGDLVAHNQGASVDKQNKSLVTEDRRQSTKDDVDIAGEVDEPIGEHGEDEEPSALSLKQTSGEENLLRRWRAGASVAGRG